MRRAHSAEGSALRLFALAVRENGGGVGGWGGITTAQSPTPDTNIRNHSVITHGCKDTGPGALAQLSPAPGPSPAPTLATAETKVGKDTQQAIPCSQSCRSSSQTCP